MKLPTLSTFIGAVCLLAVSVAGAALPKPVEKDLTRRTVVDSRARTYVTPTRVVWQSSEASAVIENADQLLNPFTDQPRLDNRAAILRNNGKVPGILLDFGRELFGGLQIIASDLKSTNRGNKTVRLRVRFGESVGEAMTELGGNENATNDHAVRDQICLVPWLGTQEIGNTGFRFARIDLVDPGTFVAIQSIRAVFLYRDLPYLGSFRCSDERLNRIWETGAYTVHLNMQNYVWDGIKRDQLVWMGDLHPEAMTISRVFGDVPIVRASLDLVRDETPLPRWMNGLSSYSMWWVLIQRDWYRSFGDLSYLRAQHSYLASLLAELAKNISPDNSEKLPETRFLDWPSSENKNAVHAGLQSLMILTFEAGLELADALDDAAMGQLCRETVARLKQHVPDHGNSKQAAALMTLANLEDAVKLNHDVMSVDGAKRMSTFGGYYILQARAKAGDYQGCLDAIRSYWGAMLDYGATTFWEDFDLEWTNNAARIDELVPAGKKDIHGSYGSYSYKGFRRSLCHGWASGPTAWLSEHVLGVVALEPGYKRVKIVPHLGDLQWAEGAIPTPQGLIKVRHEKKPDGRIETSVDAPRNIKIADK